MTGNRGLPRLALAIGDPGGIGPEVTVGALAELYGHRGWEFVPVIIGDFFYLDELLGPLRSKFQVVSQDHWTKMLGTLHPGDSGAEGLLIDRKTPFAQRVVGRPCPDNAQAAYGYFRLGAEMAETGAVSAMVTAPVHKGSINDSGIPFHGHTEAFADFFPNKRESFAHPFMLMYSKEIRMLLLSTHLPIKCVEESLDINESQLGIQRAQSFVRLFDERERPIAMLALDPHGGDNGAIGTGDKRITEPLVATLQKKGLDIRGPFAADGFFASGNWRNYGLIVSAYHDQGLIPFKINSFGGGVNVTLNLPIKRTSPDHGTAFELARKSQANHSSMVQAIELALRWCIQREEANNEKRD